MARRSDSAGAYHGVSGFGERFFIALLNSSHEPIEKLSGTFATRVEALPHLRWLRRRHRGARLVREVTVRMVED